MTDKRIQNTRCMQHFSPDDMIEYHCDYTQCRYCGHNYSVSKYRKRQIAKYGLVKGKDGLWRYKVIKKERKSSGRN